jgi:hypothetical protein
VDNRSLELARELNEFGVRSGAPRATQNGYPLWSIQKRCEYVDFVV